MKITLAFLLLLFVSANAIAQSLENRLTQSHISCYDVFANAADAVPSFYDSRSFDSIQQTVNIVQRYCDSNNATIFFLKTLLDIQQSNFSVTHFPQNGSLDGWLQTYAISFRNRYNRNYSASRYLYYRDNAESKLYGVIQLWAKDLLADRKLNDNEAFLCGVLAGNIPHPQATIKANKNKYPELYALLRANYSAERKGPDGNLAFMSGVGLPSGNAKLLGVHPSLGLQVGARSHHNEFDVILDFRFVSAANNYNILRRDSLYSIHHFFGGYFGFDYTRYLFHTTSFELGATGGIGYDGFDVTDDTDNDSKDYLKPYSIGSLNLNAGLRCNYYFNPHFYIGIGGKFNKIRYTNSGGTNLHGNTVSLDLFIGG